MREIDDVIDDDAPLPSGWKTRSEYLDRKINFLDERKSPIDDVEQVMLRCIQRIELAFGDDAGQSLWQASASVLNEQRFDSDRGRAFIETGTPHVFSEKALGTYVTDMELDGAMKGFLTVLGDDYKAVEALAPFVHATRRHFYFLRDLQQDVSAGRINLTTEECPSGDNGTGLESLVKESVVIANGEHAKMSSWQRSRLLHNRVPQFAADWMEKQLSTGEQELQVHHSEKRGNSFRPFTRLLLHLLHQKPANTYFGKFRRLLGNQQV